jgi:protocatechuate 3,4-dioxygenase, beta subunit
MDRRQFGAAVAGLIVAACGPRSLAAPPDLYACEGCEALFERDPGALAARARLGAMQEQGDPLRLEGIVYRTDGRTPAEGVVVYAHHTNAEGLYANGTNETEWSRRHGRLRGWVRTGRDGRYTFDTVKPGVYPDRTEPAHIHLMVLEPERRPYWIDDVVFEGEFGVTDAWRARQQNRGGPGVVRLKRDGAGMWLARRDIILDRHPR